MSSLTRREFLTTSAVSAAALTAPVGPTYNIEPGILPVRPLGLTGLMPTILGFGGGSRWLMNDLDSAEKIINRAIELGVRYFDTAYTYGENRESMKRYGRFLVPNHRDKIILVTKISGRDADTAARQSEECFTDLKTDKIDILHFHGIENKDEVDQIIAADGALNVVRKLKETGAIRAIGVTGHADSKVMLYALEKIQPDCIMTPQNPGHEKAQTDGYSFTSDVIPYAIKNGIGLLAMKTTGQDALSGKGGVKPPELVRYAMSLPVSSAIVGMRSIEVLNSCADVARTLVPMTDSEMTEVRDRVMQGVDIGEVLLYLRPGYHDGIMTT